MVNGPTKGCALGVDLVKGILSGVMAARELGGVDARRDLPLVGAGFGLMSLARDQLTLAQLRGGRGFVEAPKERRRYFIRAQWLLSSLAQHARKR